MSNRKPPSWKRERAKRFELEVGNQTYGVLKKEMRRKAAEKEQAEARERKRKKKAGE
jgi:hypothetical protein